MLLDNYKKQSPIVGVAGLGGGINSYIFLSSGGGDYVISKSLRFNDNDSAYLTRTPSSASDRQKWTWAAWVKKTSLTTNNTLFSADASNSDFVTIRFESDTIRFDCQGDGQSRVQVTTTAVYRDPSAWYHIVIALDTTQSTAADRCKIYINNILQTTSNTITQNKNFVVNSTVNHEIGRRSDGNDHYFDGYLADVHLVDGQQLAPTEFGETDSDGVWQPKKYSGTYGTNGFHLDFKDTSSIGNDAAGSNNWTANNITTAVYGLATANQGFDAVIYTGNGASTPGGSGSTQTISSLSFQPDLVWIKCRSRAGQNHNLIDVIRGAPNVLTSDQTIAEVTNSTDGFTAFTSNGFTLGDNGEGTQSLEMNRDGDTYVAWCWRAGGSASSNSNGTITSSVSASTTYGFSVVTWTGAGTGSAKTVGHSLGAVPKFIITKSRTLTDNWGCYHASLGSTKDIFLNTTGIPRSYPTWNNTDPTSSVFSVGQTGQVNESGETYVAYCWSEISGYSKFSSYTGNGNAEGTIVTTGFKPRFVVVKRTDVVDNWAVFDSARSLNNDLKWNTAEVEGSAPVEFLSDGFQLKNTYGSTNASGGTYIYAAFASKPDQSAIDVLIDSPAQSVADETDTGLGGQITGNYATLNPLNKHNSADTFSEGNLKLTSSGSGAGHFGRSTIAMSAGKYYWEVTWDDTSHNFVGIQGQNDINYNNSYVYLSNAKASANNGSSEGSGYGASWGNGDVIGIAFDADNATLAFYKNGISQGTAFTSITGTYSPYPDGYVAFFGNWNNQSCTFNVNFGQRAFVHAAPSGYKCLTVENLSDPTGAAAEPNKYFDTKLWTGDGASTRTISNYDFSPDFIWIKNRTTSGWQHVLYDQIRGAGTGSVTKSLSSDSTRSEASGNDTNHGYLSGYTSDGYSLVKGSQSGGDYVNHNGWDYVGWAWDGGTSTVTNTAGSINSQVRADQAAGFSIVTYTGVTGNKSFGHGLNVKPKFILIKNTSNTADWFAMFDTGAASYQHGYLNGNSQFYTASAQPVSTSTITYGNNNAMFGANGDNYVAYCFAPILGYSAMNTYTGNGSADGVFVYTGFKPAFLLTKRTDSAENWEIRDNKRNPFNRVNRALYPHTSGAEDNGSIDVDFLSNGFKIRTTNGSMNASGGTYMYYAVAESPFKTTRAR